MQDFSKIFTDLLKLPIFWHLSGIAVIVCLFAVDRVSKRSGIFIVFLWNFCGVLLHELAHLLTGILLFAKPTGFSLIPRRQGTGYVLGSVKFLGLNPINAPFVALAPLGLIIAAYYLFRFWSLWIQPTLISTVSIYGVLFVLVYNAIPSRQDLKVAFGWKSLVFYGFVSFLLIRHWKALTAIIGQIFL